MTHPSCFSNNNVLMLLSFLLLWIFQCAEFSQALVAVPQKTISKPCASPLESATGTGTAASSTTASSSSTASSTAATASSTATATDDHNVVHTLLLCRHGDSIWNGGEPGTRETFTGWTNVPLSSKGIREAQDTGRQLSEQYSLGIDACFTSNLQRAQLTAHYCLWAFSEQPNHLSPRRYIQDYRLNERHYGALQGLVKEDVEKGLHTELYGGGRSEFDPFDPKLVQQWRRSWHAIPPLLDEDDPRRLEELRSFSNMCGGPEFVPRGESLEQVAQQRVRPFLEQVVCPVLLEQAAAKNFTNNNNNNNHSEAPSSSSITAGEPPNIQIHGGTGLIVAHANSLRALIGVLCEIEQEPAAAASLAKLEALRLQTGVPLVIKFRQHRETEGCGGGLVGGRAKYQVCDLDGVPIMSNSKSTSDQNKNRDLPVFPLSCIPMMRGGR